MKNQRFRGIILLLITFLVGYYVGVTKIQVEWKNYKPVIQATSKEPPAEVTNVDFSQFWVVWQKLAENYYDKSKLDPQKMLNGAISGMTQSLGDPFTVYLPPSQNTNFKQGLAGQFSGIGAELGTKDNDIIVIAPLDGTPAQRAGIKAGDKITKVDGDSTAGWTISQAVDRIRGPRGTEVILTVMHKDQNKEVDIKIVRDTITVKSVSGFVKKASEFEDVTKDKFKGSNANIMYIRLSQFGDNTNKDWLALVEKLYAQVENDSDFEGVIFDLRNNPGGYLSDAVFIASEFLSQGQPVVIEETGTSFRRSLNVERRGRFQNTEVIVLINKGSASASEIVAGALQDHGKARLLGETSYGKGTIQEATDFGNGAGLHVTIAKWLTPKGTWVNEKGLTPDIKVASDGKNLDPQLEKAIEELIK
jgi:carboxyl-terminal processing protease